VHGAPAEFLAEISGGAVRSAKGTDGHGSWAGALRSSVGLEKSLGVSRWSLQFGFLERWCEGV